MRLQSLLDLPELGLELLCGQNELNRKVSWAVATDLIDPGRYLNGGELVLTGLVWRQKPSDSARFVEAVSRVPIAGIAAGVAGSDRLPDDLLGACRERRIPLFRVPPDIAFATVTEKVAQRVSSERNADLAEVLGRHRRLVSATVCQAAGAAAAAAAGMSPVLELVERDLGLYCRVLTPAGRVVAGSPLDNRLRSRIVRTYLTGGTPPHVVPLSGSDAGSAGQVLSCFGVRPASRPDAGRLAGWIIAVDSDYREWPAERRHLVDELVALAAAEYGQLEQRLGAGRQLADDLVSLVAASAGTTELEPRLAVYGISESTSVRILVASLSDRADGARTVLEDLLSWSVPGSVVASTCEGSAVALVPDPPAGFVDELSASLSMFAPGLGRGRLLVGVSGVVSTSGLHGGLEEARHAHRLATLRTEQVAIAGHDDLASHMLLLAATPDDVRRQFRERVLGPLAAYDQTHRTDLVPTLRAFLACGGSWAKCAEALHVHVNTLRYRVQRIEQLTGRDLRKLEDQVDFFLALAV